MARNGTANRQAAAPRPAASSDFAERLAPARALGGHGVARVDRTQMTRDGLASLSLGAVRLQADGAADFRVTLHVEPYRIGDQLGDSAFVLGVTVQGFPFDQPPGRFEELAQAHVAFR